MSLSRLTRSSERRATASCSPTAQIWAYARAVSAATVTRTASRWASLTSLPAPAASIEYRT